jgi:hypothetical protein
LGTAFLTAAANTDNCRAAFAPPHSGQLTASPAERTSRSKSLPHFLHWYS